MPRKKKEGQKPRKIRMKKERRVERDPSDLSWLSLSRQMMAAAKLLNVCEKSFGLSIHWPLDKGNAPVSPRFPCRYYRAGSRLYYLYAFIEHRNEVYDLWQYGHDARKEYRDTIARHDARRQN